MDDGKAVLNVDRLVEAISEDRQLKPEEKETQFHFTKADDEAVIYTEEAGISRRLIQHPLVHVVELRVTTDQIWGKRVNPADFDGGTITGLKAKGPIGALKFGIRCRSTSGHASVVSRPQEGGR